MKGVTTARNKFNSSKARFSKQNAKMLAHFRLAFNYNSHHIPLFSFTYSILPSSSIICFVSPCSLPSAAMESSAVLTPLLVPTTICARLLPVFTGWESYS